MKKQRVSKRNKTAWRKHVDTRDVDEFLEEQRLDERLGKFGEKPDSELFVIDTGPSEEGKEQHPEPAPAARPSRKQLKRQQLPATPKCFETLLPTSKVEDPNTKRNIVNPVGHLPTALSKLSVARREARGTTARRAELVARDQDKAKQDKRVSRRERGTFQDDLWTTGDGAPSELSALQSSGWLGLAAAKHAAQVSTLRPPRAIRVVPRAAPPPVPVPHSALSYNPTYQEHQVLLSAVAERERRLMKREAHLQRVTTHMFRRCSQDQRQAAWLHEMRAGLPTAPGDAATVRSEGESDGEYHAVGAPVRNKAKDVRAKRRRLERFREAEEARRRRQDKKKLADVYKLRFLKSGLERAELRSAKLRAERRERRDLRRADTAPQLGPTRPTPDEVPFSPAENLTGDLRTVANQGNPLRDRFESLVRRGALPATKLRMRKKRRVKPYFKPGHKVTEQDVQRYLNPAAGTSPSTEAPGAARLAGRTAGGKPNLADKKEAKPVRTRKQARREGKIARRTRNKK